MELSLLDGSRVYIGTSRLNWFTLSLEALAFLMVHTFSSAPSVESGSTLLLRHAQRRWVHFGFGFGVSHLRQSLDVLLVSRKS